MISHAVIDAADCLRNFTTAHRNAGAIVSFSGQVRSSSDSGRVTCLHLQSLPPLTENSIRNAVKNAEKRWSLDGVLARHRIGDMMPGDTVVFVATASAHRRAAFEAADFLMDYLKTEAIFWKKEVTDSASEWIEPRPQDYSDALRWEQN